MKFKFSIKILFIFFIILAAGQSVIFAQKQRVSVKTRILFIFDESNSMNANWESRKKIDVAKELLIKIVDSLKNINNVEMALRMYGHQSHVPPQDCSDTRLEVPFGTHNAEKIKHKLRVTKPKGTTPIANSLEACGDDFPNCNNCRNVVILITDGIEACDGDPCAIALTLFNKGITLKPFIIGIGLDMKFKDAFECIGQYYNANNEKKFQEIMKEVIKKAITGTTAEIDLLNIEGKAKETNVNITLYNQKNGEIFKNFIHTLNRKGKPDTLSLPTYLSYKMTVHTIPEITVENIKLENGKHNKIIAKTPQGSLNVTQKQGRTHKGVKFIVRKQGKTKTINVQEFFEPEKYIVGKYDLEILTLPRIYETGIEIKQSKTTTITVPQPGLINIFFPPKGYGGIYMIKNNKITLVKTFNNTKKVNLYLQPGNYVAVYRAEIHKLTSFSSEKHFTVKSGRSATISFK